MSIATPQGVRTLFLPLVACIALLTSCSPQDKEQARRDTRKAEQKIREGARSAGREIKKDLRVADNQLQDSLEKGRAAAQHAGRKLRKELSDDDADRSRP